MREKLKRGRVGERERVCVGVAACKCYAIMRNKSSEKRQATLQGGMRFKCQPFIKPADGQMANGKRKMTLERAEGSQSRQSRQSARQSTLDPLVPVVCVTMCKKSIR